MSLQVFLEARLLGTEEFLRTPESDSSEAELDLLGRCSWLTLYCEVLPRALLAELKLSRMLLGSSSAEQFLLVLAEEDIPRANDFLGRAAKALKSIGHGALRLVWASTENLGAWPVVRKRLNDALATRICCPCLDATGTEIAGLFSPFVNEASSPASFSFARFAAALVSAKTVGWSPDKAAELIPDAGAYSWPLLEQSGAGGEEGILFPRRIATDDEGTAPASLAELATRAEGASRWAVLRGDVDGYEQQLQRASSVEDHIHFSAMFKEFFAGELAILCALPEFWRKVTILYRGGDDFAVAGSWDALLLLARELHRLFEKFSEHNLSTLPGIEGKSISMALAIAPDTETAASEVFAEAGAELYSAKSSEAGTIAVFGRPLEWKRMADAEELKSSLVRLVKDFRYPAAYLNDLAAVYREAFASRAARRGKAARVDKPWRTYMRLSRVIPPARGREQNNVRSAVITSLIGKRTANLKLRPSARVGLEWARLAAGA